jgi:DUF1680 family protein
MELAVGLFVDSEVEWQGVRLTQSTRFPEEPSTKLTLQLENEKQFVLKIRQPEWLGPKGLRLTINGKTYKPKLENSWLSIDQVWRNGDCVEVHFDMVLCFEPICPELPQRVALLYGPVMLALTGEDGPPMIGFPEKPNELLEQDPSRPLAFHFRKETPEFRMFRPFYEIGHQEPYYVYNDIYEPLEE